MMMVGRSAAGQLPYSPLIQLSLIVRTTDLKNKQKDKRFIKRCFFLSFFTIDDFNKKKTFLWNYFSSNSIFSGEVFFFSGSVVSKYFSLIARSLPSPCWWLRKVVLTLLRSKRTPAKRTNSLFPSLSIHTEYRLAPTRNPTLDGFNAGTFLLN